MRHESNRLKVCCAVLFSIGALLFSAALTKSTRLSAEAESSSVRAEDRLHRADHAVNGATLQLGQDNLRAVDEQDLGDVAGSFEV